MMLYILEHLGRVNIGRLNELRELDDVFNGIAHRSHELAVVLLHLREQKPIVTSRSQPEPDLAVMRGPATLYYEKHPRPVDVFLTVEVSDSSLEDDRERKGRIYAQAKLPVYWIIIILESKVEVYSSPHGGNRPRYLERNDFDLEGIIPLVIQDQKIATIPVRELFFIPERKK